MQRSEIVLKKFGLLDRDFDLKPFLLSLLKEQIEAYYDPKTENRQPARLGRMSTSRSRCWPTSSPTPCRTSTSISTSGATRRHPTSPPTPATTRPHLAKDELDTAREAVTEGQATAVMMDNILKPMGHSLLKDPEVVEAHQSSK